MASQVNFMSGLSSGMDNAVLGMIIVLIMVLFFGLIFLMIWYKKYNKHVIVRKVINGKERIFTDKLRFLKNKDGVELYKFLKLRKEVKIPPSDSIDITNKGNEFLECYIKETGEISWAKSSYENFKVIEPFTTEDRQFLQYQFYKAHLEGGVNWKDLIVPIFGIVALVIITVSLMIFYKDMGEPLLEMGDKLSSFQDKQLEMLEKMDIMLERICSNGGNCTGAQTIKNQAKPIGG